MKSLDRFVAASVVCSGPQLVDVHHFTELFDDLAFKFSASIR